MILVIGLSLLVGTLAVAFATNLMFRLLPMGVSWHRFVDSIFVHLSFTEVPLNARCIEYRECSPPLTSLMHEPFTRGQRYLRRSSPFSKQMHPVSCVTQRLKNAEIHHAETGASFR